MLRQTKKIRLTLYCGNLPNKQSHLRPNGSRLGVWVAQVGISNARQWVLAAWATPSTSTAADMICSFRTTRTKLPNLKAQPVKPMPTTGCTWALSMLTARKCQNHWVISLPFAMWWGSFTQRPFVSLFYRVIIAAQWISQIAPLKKPKPASRVYIKP